MAESEVESPEAQTPDEEPDMDDAKPEGELSDNEDDADEYEDETEEEDGDGDVCLEGEKDFSAEDAVQSSGCVDTDELNINVDFNLGHGMVRIADLRTLAPGYIFKLEEKPGAEVAIIAGGQEIGRGEIVQIAERLGVRIVSLKGSSHA
ncbi:MAG: FliM/FliN family flagellar motor switch protein [Pseudomonadota bacterium]